MPLKNIIIIIRLLIKKTTHLHKRTFHHNKLLLQYHYVPTKYLKKRGDKICTKIHFLYKKPFTIFSQGKNDFIKGNPPNIFVIKRYWIFDA
ncbi:MAG TPA: hypothetical protein DD405_07405 [Desulfobacteraceae bacterium]|nr:hypothetical protein [Desulfobacteraceae bacterium]